MRISIDGRWALLGALAHSYAALCQHEVMGCPKTLINTVVGGVSGLTKHLGSDDSPLRIEPSSIEKSTLPANLEILRAAVGVSVE